jgi:hypothetical protein
MNYKEKIIEFNKLFIEKRILFDKTYFQHLSGKDTTRGRMLGFMSKEYWVREKLWKTGRFVWAYSFKTYSDRLHDDRPYASWVLFSLANEINEKPDILIDVYQKLEQFIQSKKISRKERKLMIALTGKYSEPKYLQIPEIYTKGKLVYLSMVYVFPQHFQKFTLGLHPIIVNYNLTREVMYVPEKLIQSLKEDIEKIDIVKN